MFPLPEDYLDIQISVDCERTPDIKVALHLDSTVDLELAEDFDFVTVQLW